MGEESEGIPFYEQVPGRATAHHAALPAPHPPRGGPQPRRRLLGRMPGLREAGTKAGDTRGSEGSLLRGRVNGATVRTRQEPPEKGRTIAGVAPFFLSLGVALLMREWESLPGTTTSSVD